VIDGIILVVIDCLRADHVSAYGYQRETTPTLDALANEGILWEQAYSTSSWTKPSVASILTGLYPSAHGAFEGVKRGRGRDSLTTDRLKTGAPTIATQLSQAGWKCGAFLNNAQLGEFAGLSRGFDSYNASMGKADNILAGLKDWLVQEENAPHFAYLHFLEAHWPYKPRRRHVAQFGGNRDTNCFSTLSARDYGKLRREIKRGQRSLSDDEITQMVQMYDASVRRLDGKIKILRGMLNDLGSSDRYAIVVTADHGDEFMDHGAIGHGHTLYDEITHVPLIAHIPGRKRGSRRPRPVSLVDLGGLIFSLAGVGDNGPTSDILMGEDRARPVFCELRTGRRYQQTLRTEFWKIHRTCLFDMEAAGGPSNATPRQLFGEYAREVTYELYDMLRDPGEKTNLADCADTSGVLKNHINMLDRHWRQLDCPYEESASSEVSIDRELVGRLERLGYLD
jgi:arylsulfatase A-like enzyme